MSQLVDDCPRCNTKRIAFEVKSEVHVRTNFSWQSELEMFCVCAHCNTSTIFVVSFREPNMERALSNSGGLVGFNGGINRFVNVMGYVNAGNKATISAPEFLPGNILAAFDEGAKCLAVRCFNAAGTMFRLCVDMTTNDKLPESEHPGLNSKTRRDLGLRLPWLFENHLLPEDLRDLSNCIKEDGNDGAHQGTLTEADAMDLLDFTEALLKRVYTEPERLRQAKERREQRRAR